MNKTIAWTAIERYRMLQAASVPRQDRDMMAALYRMKLIERLMFSEAEKALIGYREEGGQASFTPGIEVPVELSGRERTLLRELAMQPPGPWLVGPGEPTINALEKLWVKLESIDNGRDLVAVNLSKRELTFLAALLSQAFSDRIN